MGLTARYAVFLYTHRRARRMWRVWRATLSVWIIAVTLAAPANASVMANVLSWTGLHDSYRVPLGQHFVSLVPVLEAIQEDGPHVSASPMTWPPAIGHMVATWTTYQGLGSLLSAEATGLSTMVGLTVWVVGFALMATWLAWLAALARPLIAQMTAVADHLYIAPFSLLGAIVMGVLAARRDGHGRGLGIIIGGVAIIAAGWVTLGNPADDVLGDNGILGFARTIAFSVSEGIAHNGALASGDTHAQLDALQTGLVDVLVRRPIEQINFSQVIDGQGKCGQLYSAALMTGQSDEPAHKMQTCGLTPALTAARSLNASDAAAFAFVIIMVGLICLALNFVSMEVLVIGAQSFWNVLIVPYAVTLAAPPGPTREFGKSRVAEVFKLGLQYFFACLGVGVLVVMMYNASSPWVGQTINMTHPVAQLTSMMMLALAGAVGFYFLLRSFGRRTIAGAVWAGTGGKAWRMLSAGKNGQLHKSESDRRRERINELVEQRRRDNQVRRNGEDAGSTAGLPARRPFVDIAAEDDGGMPRKRLTPAQAKSAADAAAAVGGIRAGSGAATAVLERTREPVPRSGSGSSPSPRTSSAGRSDKSASHGGRRQLPDSRPGLPGMTVDLGGADTDGGGDDHPRRRSQPPSAKT